MINVSLLVCFRAAPFFFYSWQQKQGFLAAYTRSSTEHKALVKD